MHPVADKITILNFEGDMDIMGKARGVSYMGAVAHDGKEVEKAVLSITGLTTAEAWNVLSLLQGPALVSTSTPVTPPKATNGISVVKEPPKAAKPTPAPPPKAVVKEPDPEPEDEDLGDLDEGEAGDSLDVANLDVDHMAKQEKLRPVIEHMIAKGFNTPELILSAAKHLIPLVPTIKAVNEKGGFDKRIEKAAMVVLGHDGSA